MREFMILDKNGEMVSMRTLDAEAAELWGKPLDSKWYADPLDSDVEVFYHQLANWFDYLTYWIADADNTWRGLVHVLIRENVPTKLNEELVKEYGYDVVRQHSMDMWAKHLKPYIDLVRLWKKKGYRPVKL